MSNKLTPQNLAYSWQVNRVGIIAMKFERMQIYFVIDDFTAVAVVVVSLLEKKKQANTLQIFFRTDSFGLLDSVKEIKD